MADAAARVLSKPSLNDAFDKHKQTIIRLYRDEGVTLSDLVVRMKREHDFVATKRQYIYRLENWGVHKYKRTQTKQSQPATNLHAAIDQGRTSAAPDFLPIWVEDPPRYRHRSTDQTRSREPTASPDPMVLPEPDFFHGVLPEAFFPRRGLREPDFPRRPRIMPARLGRKITPWDDELEEEEEREEEEEDPRPDPKRRKGRDGRLGAPPSGFACPFRKRNARRFNVRDYLVCATSAFPDMRHVIQHLIRAHPIGHVCPRCYAQFPTVSLLTTHLRQAEACSIADKAPPSSEGVTLDMQALLLSREPGSLTWPEMCGIVFPGDTMIPPPDFQPVVELHDVKYAVQENTWMFARLLERASPTGLSEMKLMGLLRTFCNDVLPSVPLRYFRVAGTSVTSPPSNLDPITGPEMEVVVSGSSAQRNRQEKNIQGTAGSLSNEAQVMPSDPSSPLPAEEM